MRQSRASPASKARRARFCVKPFRPRHHRLPRGPSREAVVSVCLMHPTKGFRPMTGSTVRMPSNLSLTDCKARVTSRAQGAIGVCSSHPQASRHYHQRQRRPYGPHQQWRRGPKPNRRPRPQPLCHTGSRCGGSRRGVGWVSLCVFLCLALPCRQRHGQTERYCPASAIAVSSRRSVIVGDLSFAAWVCLGSDTATSRCQGSALPLTVKPVATHFERAGGS